MQYSKLQDKSRVLIILMGALGDVVRGLHIADAIKSSNPSVIIDWLVEPKCEGIVRLSPSVNSVIVFTRTKPFSGVISLYKTLRQNRYEYVLDMQRHFKSGLFSFLTGANHRIGFHRIDSKEGNFLFSTETIPYQKEVENKFYHYQRFLDVLGVDRPKSYETKLLFSQRNSFLNRSDGSLNVFVTLGSSWNSKNWFVEGYIEVIKQLLLNPTIKIALIGGNDQLEQATKIESHFQAPRIVNVVGKTSLDDLCSIISNSNAGFGPDSGPGHIASALGVPYVALFGPTDPNLVAPAGMEGLVVRSGVGCSPCYKRQCPGLGEVCMRQLSPHIISNKLLQSLKIL
jgi:heptosyltransferase-1